MQDNDRPTKSETQSPRKLTDLTIVLPAYNEEAAIGKTLDELKERYPGTEMLVVDDGSSDRTGEIVRSRQVKLVRHPENRGYGASWKTGIATATSPYVAFYDSDNQFNSEDLGRIYDVFRSSPVDMVSGRRRPGSHVEPVRAPGKALVGWVSRLLVGKPIPDLNCGLRIFRRAHIAQYARLLPNSFSASATSMVLFMNRGYRVEFVDIVTKKRVGKSSVSIIRDGFNTIVLIMRLVALFNPIRLFSIVAAILFAIGLSYSVTEALIRGLGVPVLGAVLLIAGILVFFIGLVCDQIAALRLELYEGALHFPAALDNRATVVEDPSQTVAEEG